MCPLTYLPSPLTGILLHRLNRLLLGEFLIIGLVFGAEFWRDCSSLHKLSKMLLFVLIGFSMSERCLVEHKGVCCLLFPCAVTLKAHSVLYKEFHNESFGEYLSCVNSFVKSYYVFESKLV